MTADLNRKLILVRVGDSPADVQTELEYLTRMQVQLAVQHPNLVIETDLRVAEAAVGIAEAIAKQEAALVVMRATRAVARCGRFWATSQAT